mgnify:FL=1
MQYKVKLTEEEINRINLVDNYNMRKSLMSVYAYMIKTNEKLNNTYANLNLKKDPFKLQISFRKLLAAYKRYHSIKNLQTLKNRIDKLIKLGLLGVEKIKNKSFYTFCRFLQLDKKVDKKLDKKNPTKPIENTILNGDEHLPKSKSFNSINNFNSNTKATERKKISSLEESKKIVFKAFKDLRVKSKWIKQRVLNKIERYWDKLYKDAAMSYIYKIINSARKAYYANYNKYIKNSNIYKNEVAQELSTFNNFPQRNYNFQELEKKLLGWE